MIILAGMRTLLVTVTLLCLAATGCGSDDHSHPPECKEIAATCHSVDPGSGPIHECHENAEGKWSKSECVSNRPMCLNVCKAAATPDGSAGN